MNSGDSPKKNKNKNTTTIIWLRYVGGRRDFEGKNDVCHKLVEESVHMVI